MGQRLVWPHLTKHRGVLTRSSGAATQPGFLSWKWCLPGQNPSWIMTLNDRIWRPLHQKVGEKHTASGFPRRLLFDRSTTQFKINYQIKLNCWLNLPHRLESRTKVSACLCLGAVGEKERTIQDFIHNIVPSNCPNGSGNKPHCNQ